MGKCSVHKFFFQCKTVKLNYYFDIVINIIGLGLNKCGAKLMNFFLFRCCVEVFMNLHLMERFATTTMQRLEGKI